MAKLYKDKFKDLESFEAQNYLKNLAKLNKELRELEERATKGQTELEQRITSVNKKYNMVLPTSYVDAITKTVQKIDLVDTKKRLDDKLGGELDYDEFWSDFQSLQTDIKTCRDEYALKVKELEPIVPQKPSKAELDELNKLGTQPSILDSIKKRIQEVKQIAGPAAAVAQFHDGSNVKGRDSSLPKGPAPKPVPQSSPQQPKARHQNVSIVSSRPLPAPKKVLNKYTKPDYLRRIDSKPLPCAVDIRFRKLQSDPNDYNTFFDDPDPQQLEELKQRMAKPYHQQLRDEYAATKPPVDPVPERPPNTMRREVTFSNQYDERYVPRGTSDPTVRKAQKDLDDLNPQDLQPHNNRSPNQLNAPGVGLNTQELLKKNPGRLSQPSQDSDVVPKSIDDFYTSAPKLKDTFTVDDRLGENPPVDEALLKDCLRNNLDSMRQFFKTKSDESQPFRNFSPSAEKELAPPRPPRRMPEFDPNRDSGASPAELEQQNKQLAQQISTNIASLLNDIVANTRLAPVQPQIPKNWVPLDDMKAGSSEAPNKAPAVVKPKSSLDEHYGMLNNMSQSRGIRVPQLLEMHQPDPNMDPSAL